MGRRANHSKNGKAIRRMESSIFGPMLDDLRLFIPPTSSFILPRHPLEETRDFATTRCSPKGGDGAGLTWRPNRAEPDGHASGARVRYELARERRVVVGVSSGRGKGR